jgi:hypothetical protein
MTTPMQKADQRPISFVLHNMAFGEPPVEVKLVIRPEDLTRTDTSRLNTMQTLGGAWGDNFGPGIPLVQLAGTTGWGSGGRPDGLAEFEYLHKTIFVEWHKKRAEVLDAGLDPDLVKLIFLDKLDNFEWVVGPQNFVLKRNKQRPLLSQYQINLTWLSYDVAESLDALDSLLSADSLSELELDGLDSMMASVKKIEQFASDIQKKIGDVLGPIKDAFNRVVTLTAKVLNAVNRVIKAGMGVVSAITNGLLGLATSLTRAAANITGIVQGIISVPMRIKAQFQRVFLAFENAFCVLRNIFRRRQFLPNYDALYGASLCSSTAGGRPISRFDTENPWPVLYPVKTSAVSVSSSASSALSRLATADPVLQPPTSAMLGADMQSVNNGITVTA